MNKKNPNLLFGNETILCAFCPVFFICTDNLLSLQVFNAYQAGVGALRLSMKDVTVEKAESLVDQIQEVQEGPWQDTSRRRRGALWDLSFLFSQTRLFTR